MKRALVLFDFYLRLKDNPAWTNAVKKYEVLPVYILDPELEEWLIPGASSRYFFEESIASLNDSLNGNLIVIKGDWDKNIEYISQKYNIDILVHNKSPIKLFDNRYFNFEYKNNHINIEKYSIVDGYTSDDNILNNTGGIYKVFTPFYNKLKTLTEDYQELSPCQVVRYVQLQNEDKFCLSGGKKGERIAEKRWNEFKSRFLSSYDKDRDYPIKQATSNLSTSLHFGEISVARMLHEARTLPNSEPFTRQLAWRSFAKNFYDNFPEADRLEWNPKYRNFSWGSNQAVLQSWKDGETGVPLIDAAMNELNQTGQMHNRLRMLCSSFLVKQLGQDWRYGLEYFYEKLEDADRPNNAFGWQWAAGCGADAAPYYRIFNPNTQAKKFDPDNEYINQWNRCTKLMGESQLKALSKKALERYKRYLV